MARRIQLEGTELYEGYQHAINAGVGIPTGGSGGLPQGAAIDSQGNPALDSNGAYGIETAA
jgi:hypothetical protein